jgi:hypothetical protein
MVKIKKIVFLNVLFSSSFIYSQQGLSQPKYKKTVRIGIYTPSKVMLHTRLISDIAQEYIYESKYFDTLRKKKEVGFVNNDNAHKTYIEFTKDSLIFTIVKARFDTCDVIERAFSICAWTLSFSLNSMVTPASDGTFFYDTLYVLFAKKEDVNGANYKQIMNRDTLDYLIAIHNLQSEPYKKYYNIKYSTIIYSKKDVSETHEMTSNYIDDFEEGNLLPHENPVQCLASHLIALNIVIVKKLIKDGFPVRQ